MATASNPLGLEEVTKMKFVPEVELLKSGDTLTVLVRQRYKARGVRTAYRWRLAARFSLRELQAEEFKSEA